MSSLQKQLAAIAAESSNQIDLKAQRVAHSKSLLFEAQSARDQDFYTLFQICYDGYAELCALDHRFISFRTTLFNEQSINTERLQFTLEEAADLNKTLENFMSLIGGRLLLRPAIKAIEWLIRRFRIHEYNADLCILTFLPYHATDLFATLLSILPSKLSSTYKFLHPYLSSLTSPPRRAILHALSQNRDFFTTFNEWVFSVTQRDHHYAALLSCWASLITETVGAMTDGAHSGRKVIKSARVEDLLLLLLPVLNRALSFIGVVEMLQGCCMIISVLVSRIELSNRFLDALLEALLPHLAGSSQDCALVSYLSISRLNNLESTLLRLSEHSDVTRFYLAYLSALLDDAALQQNHLRVLTFFEAKLFDKVQLYYFLQHAMKREADFKTHQDHQSQIIRSLLHELLEFPEVCDIAEDLLKNRGINDKETRTKIQKKRRGSGFIDDIETRIVSPMQEVPISQRPLKQITPSEFADGFVPNESYMTFSSTDRYMQLLDIINNTISTPEWFAGTVDVLVSKLLSEPALEIPIASFLLRFSLSRFSDNLRIAAFEALAGWFMSKSEGNGDDMQIVLPYLIVHLSDKSRKLRMISAQCLQLLKRTYSSQQDEKRKAEKQTIWGEDNFHGLKSRKLLKLSSNETLKILTIVVLPHLEEVILDRKHISRIVRIALSGSSGNTEKAMKLPNIELKSSLRSKFASFLGHHAANTYALLAKCHLYSLIKGTGKIIRHIRSSVLLPALREWASLDHEEVSQICEADGITLAEIEIAHIEIIDCKEPESVECLRLLLGGKYGSGRSELREFAFQRLISLWPNAKFEARDAMADYLLNLSIEIRSDPSLETSKTLALETLRSLTLSTSTLASFLTFLHSSYQNLLKVSQQKKRKANGLPKSEIIKTSNTETFDKLVKDYTFVLELVESSQPENHPPLLNGLFQCLDDIQNLRNMLQSELVYLQNMALSCLRAIIENLKDGEFIYDSSVVRADLVADCVRTNSSLQVQNTAITLIASLASWMPGLVIHAIMPIFTFMGNTLLRQSDDYSSYVIDETLSKALPPLITKLNQRNEDVVIGISEIILSFTASFQHIPLQRRRGIFFKLINALGTKNSLFVIIIALLDRFPNNEDVRSFVITLIRSRDPSIGLKAMVQYMEVLENIADDRSPVAEAYLHILARNEVEKTFLYENLINSLSIILSNHKIRINLARASHVPSEVEFRTDFGRLLQHTIQLSRNCPKSVKPLVMSKLLPCVFSAVPLAAFLKPAGDLLSNSNVEVKKIVLNCMGSITQPYQTKNESPITDIHDFLNRVLDVLDDSSDLDLSVAAVTCIDSIGAKFGRKDPGSLITATRMIAKPPIFDNEEDRLKIVTLLCLASLIDVLKEKFIPLSTQILPLSISHLGRSIEAGIDSIELHDAAISLLSAVLEHIPYILSIFDLNKILHLIQVSANSALSRSAAESRKLIYHLIVQNVDDGPCFKVIENLSKGAIVTGYVSLDEHLEFARRAINHHPKPTIMKNSLPLQQTLIELLDLRNVYEAEKLYHEYSDSALEAAEQKINNLAMSIIMKMNDKSFRPIFVRIVDWATTPMTTNRKALERRTISFFKFYEVFNDQLKTIVTAYATYVIKMAQSALEPAPQQDATVDLLRTSVLQGLTKNFEHDHDGFWQNPINFNALARLLTVQLQICSNTTVEAAVIPAVVSFAAAAASELHHKELNSYLLKLMRSVETKDRLAAIKCEQGLTTRLGEDWLSLLPEMLPLISEMQEDDDEAIEQEIQKWIKQIENILGEKLDSMLQ